MILRNIASPILRWSHQLHLTGAINAFRSIQSHQKWLRVHREFEWEDLYTPSSIKDLKEFFDRYLKDINNGWELVPKVRLEVQDAYSFDYDKNRTETDFPIERTTYKKVITFSKVINYKQFAPTVYTMPRYNT